MSLHVSAHGAIFRRYINKLTLLNYVFYMDPYISLSLLYAHIVFYIALKVLNKYLNLLKVLNIKLNSSNIIKILLKHGPYCIVDILVVNSHS
jgi:hypothetical protein